MIKYKIKMEVGVGVGNHSFNMYNINNKINYTKKQFMNINYERLNTDTTMVYWMSQVTTESSAVYFNLFLD